MRKQLKKLLLRGTLFLLPPLLVFSLAVVLCGEGMQTATIIRRQMEDPGIIYGPGYRDSYLYYRAEATREVSPDILILGDSRAGQFRSFFFTQPQTVYNAVWGASAPAQMLPFLQSQPEGSIKTALLVLSQYEFNANYTDVDYTLLDVYQNPAYDADMSARRATLSVLLNWKAGSFGLLPLIFHSANLVGIGAVVNDTGILADGSLYQAWEYRDRDEDETGTAHLDVTLYRIGLGVARFETGEEVNSNTIDQTRELLAYCQQQGIAVVGILPPYAPTALEAMASRADEYAYLFALYDTLAPVFAEYGAELHDYTDVTALGCTDDYFLDGFHGGEIAALRILRDMVANGSRLSAHIDTEALAILDENRYRNYQMFEDVEETLARMPRYADKA